MSSISVRPLEPKDREGLLRVISLTYNNGVPFEPDASVFAHASQFVALKGAEVVGAFGVMPMTATRGPGLMKCGGVLGVAVMPHVRGSGVGGSMMRFALKHYRDEGYELMSLYAFRESYYRAFGYETTGSRFKISVDAKALPSFKQELDSRIVDKTDIDAIRPCYTEFSSRRSGMNLRNQQQWERVLVPKAHRTVYVVGDPVEAYAIVQHQDAFWQEQFVEEVIWSSLRGYESIMAVLRGIAINKSNLAWYEPSDGPYLMNHMDHGCTITVERIPMFRLLDVPLALRALKPRASGEFVMAVADPDIVENRGTWAVQYDSNGVSVERTSASAGLEIEVRHLVQAVLGEPSLKSLVEQGFVEVADESQAIAAERLMEPSATYCADFF